MSESERKIVDIHEVRRQINPDYVPAAPVEVKISQGREIELAKREPEHALDLNELRDIASGKKIGSQVIHSNENQ